MSTRTHGGTIVVMVNAQATLSADPARLVLSVREGPLPGIWRYNLSDPSDRRIQYGRIIGKDSHLDALRHAAALCTEGYLPGTTERGLLEQLAASTADPDADTHHPA